MFRQDSRELAETCDSNETEPELDRQSFALLWDLLALLVRSNDNAEGHDFSELLLGELKTEKQPDEAEESNLDVKADRSVINEANSSARNGTFRLPTNNQSELQR